MSDHEAPLTIQHHTWVRGAIHVVEEQALKIARKRNLRPDDPAVDDLRSVGKLALYNAVRRYDPAKVKSFAGYARFRVRGAMLNSLQATTRTARIEREMARAMANRMAEYTDDFDILRHDTAEFARRLDELCEHAATTMFVAGAELARRELDDDQAEGREEYARALLLLGELVRALKAEERTLLDLLYGCGFDLQAAAERLGVVKTTAWLRLRRLLVSLRRELNKRFVYHAPHPRDDVRVPRVLHDDEGREKPV